jgi:hypothetical protein
MSTKRPNEGNPKLRITLKKFRKNMGDDEVLPTAASVPMVESSPRSSYSEPPSLEEGEIPEEFVAYNPKDKKKLDVQQILADILSSDLQSDKEQEVIKAFRKLARAVDSDGASRNLVRLNGPGFMLNVMNKWAESAAVQSSALEAILILCRRDSRDYESKDLYSLVDLMKGMETFTRIMAKFPSNCQLQYDALKVLDCLCASPHSGREKRAEKFVNKLDGVRLIVQAMKIHSQNQYVQEEGCWLLAGLCKTVVELTPSMKSEALATVCLAALNFETNQDIRKCARSYMETILGVGGNGGGLTIVHGRE